MHVYKVLPNLAKKRHMSMWHKALESQWSPRDLDWDAAGKVRSAALRRDLARVLTPILMGEQAALYSITTLVQILGQEAEVESQFYLVSMLLDEARHTELFTRYYGRLGETPMPIRRFPAGYLFQSKVMAREPSEWLVGSLVSEVLAKFSLEAFRQLDCDPLLTELTGRILEDEARHLGFNHVFLEDRSWNRFKGEVPHAVDAEAWVEHLKARLDDVLHSVPPMLEGLDSELRGVGMDPGELFERLTEDTHRRLAKSLDSGARRAREAEPEGVA